MIDAISNIIIKNKFIAKRISENSIKLVIRYLIVGFSTVFLELLLFFVLFKIFSSVMTNNSSQYFSFTREKFILLLANTLTCIVIFIYNFTLQRKFTFKSTDKRTKQIVLYTALYVFDLIVSNYIILFLVGFFTTYVFPQTGYFYFLPFKVADIAAFTAKTIAIAVVVSWNFVIYRKFIFK